MGITRTRSTEHSMNRSNNPAPSTSFFQEFISNFNCLGGDSQRIQTNVLTDDDLVLHIEDDNGSRKDPENNNKVMETLLDNSRNENVKRASNDYNKKEYVGEDSLHGEDQSNNNGDGRRHVVALFHKNYTTTDTTSDGDTKEPGYMSIFVNPSFEDKIDEKISHYMDGCFMAKENNGDDDCCSMEDISAYSVSSSSSFASINRYLLKDDCSTVMTSDNGWPSSLVNKGDILPTQESLSGPPANTNGPRTRSSSSTGASVDASQAETWIIHFLESEDHIHANNNTEGNDSVVGTSTASSTRSKLWFKLEMEGKPALILVTPQEVLECVRFLATDNVTFQSYFTWSDITIIHYSTESIIKLLENVVANPNYYFDDDDDALQQEEIHIYHNEKNKDDDNYNNNNDIVSDSDGNHSLVDSFKEDDTSSMENGKPGKKSFRSKWPFHYCRSKATCSL